VNRRLLSIACCALLWWQTPAVAQGFAAMVSPPRFELGILPGKTRRAVVEINNRAPGVARYRIRTADWSLQRDYGVQFTDQLQAGSCRPWVALERPEVTVPGGGTLRYRFEISVPADAPDGECRFALLIDGAEPTVAGSNAVRLPVTGRIGVIVYVAVGNCAPRLELFGPTTSMVNGRRVPALRIHNAGNAHGRMGGFLGGTDARGVKYDFTPSDFPILPQDEREVFLTPSTPTEDQPVLTYPVTVRGKLEWADQQIEIDQTFE
jgi:fimbrial chaperone protein